MDFILSFSFYGLKILGKASIPSGANWANTETKGIEVEAGEKEPEDRED